MPIMHAAPRTQGWCAEWQQTVPVPKELTILPIDLYTQNSQQQLYMPYGLHSLNDSPLKGLCQTPKQALKF